MIANIRFFPIGSEQAKGICGECFEDYFVELSQFKTWSQLPEHLCCACQKKIDRDVFTLARPRVTFKNIEGNTIDYCPDCWEEMKGDDVFRAIVDKTSKQQSKAIELVQKLFDGRAPRIG